MLISALPTWPALRHVTFAGTACCCCCYATDTHDTPKCVRFALITGLDLTPTRLDLSPRLAKCTALQTLDVSGTGMQDADAILLMGGLGRCSKLETLRMSNNSISSDGAVGNLAKLCKTCTALTTVTMAGSAILHTNATRRLVNGVTTHLSHQLRTLHLPMLTKNALQQLPGLVQHQHALVDLQFGVASSLSPDVAKQLAALFRERDALRRVNIVNPTAASLGDKTVSALLGGAVQGPQWKWLYNGASCSVARARHLTAAALAAAGLPPELAGDWERVMSYLAQRHNSQLGAVTTRSQTPRCTVVLIGPQGVGKTSLVWRLRHPSSSESLPAMQSTDGVALGKSE